MQMSIPPIPYDSVGSIPRTRVLFTLSLTIVDSVYSPDGIAFPLFLTIFAVDSPQIREMCGVSH